ncbi:MAG: transcription antitermination factor NusB [Acidimicrobiales bacterium]|jgi:16S rRNA (cytosine967-C5)-methyltransferase|nr:transcription antitermination factor NusB [Acidimicrobiales bacterium]
MVEDDARRVAIDAIVRIDEDGAYANVVLPKMLDDTDLEPRDKGLVTELVYGSTRRKRALDHVVDRFLVQDPPPSARAALRIGAHQLIELGTPPHAAVSATVSAAPKRFRGMVNAVLRKVATATKEGIEYPSDPIALSYPDWIVNRLRGDLGAEEADAALRIMNEAATVQKREDGYMQDESSRRVADLVPSAPRTRVLDVCAAPGGKATSIATRGAFVAAADLRGSRVGLITSNVDRLGADDVAALQADATAPPFAPGSFDAVLVDAPCSGLGALRRRADARWRITPADVDNLVALQLRILEAAAPMVRPGGTLVYSVCTLTLAESVGVVDSARTSLVGLGFRSVDPGGDGWTTLGDGVEVLLPGPAHDGMCRAVFERA